MRPKYIHPDQTSDERVEQLEAEILRLKVELETSKAAQREFLAEAAHEIKTPLSGLFGMIELLAKTQTDSQQKAIIDNLHLSSRQLHVILNDLLDHSKIEAGMFELNETNFQPLELHSLKQINISTVQEN